MPHKEVIGIAIPTYNRCKNLDALVQSIRQYTTREYTLVITDDGSTDHTADVCSKHKCNYIRSVNRGIAWNKNRGLYLLLSNTLAHTVISLEDDVIVKREAWQDHWVEMCNQYGHCTWADRNVVASKADRLILGSGTAIDPYLLKFVSGQVMSFSRTAIESAGYFDPKFRGYGYEHIDLSRRLHRLGFGFKDIKDESGRTVRGYVNIEGGIEITELPTVSDRSSVEENRRIYEDLKNDYSFRNPWKDGVERQIFLDEIASSVEYPIEAVRSSV